MANPGVLLPNRAVIMRRVVPMDIWHCYEHIDLNRYDESISNYKLSLPPGWVAVQYHQGKAGLESFYPMDEARVWFGMYKGDGVQDLQRAAIGYELQYGDLTAEATFKRIYDLQPHKTQSASVVTIALGLTTKTDLDHLTQARLIIPPMYSANSVRVNFSWLGFCHAKLAADVLWKS